jgi:hypothetical protein
VPPTVRVTTSAPSYRFGIVILVAGPVSATVADEVGLAAGVMASGRVSMPP